MNEPGRSPFSSDVLQLGECTKVSIPPLLLEDIAEHVKVGAKISAISAQRRC
jgi:hypothetical protein